MARKSLYIGIDLGGTKIHAALVTPGGIVLDRIKTPTPTGKGKARGRKVIESITDCVKTLTESAKENHNNSVAAIGLAMPGPVNYNNNTVPFMPNIDIAGADLAGELTSLIDAKIVLANDADATAVGEAWFGPAGKNSKCFIDIAVGTGIGGGIVIDGQLYRGPAGSAAEIGHIIMQPDGELCGCGNRGCAETLASRTAIERMLRKEISEGRAEILSDMLEDPNAKIRSGALARSYKAGDKSVKKVLDYASTILGYNCLTLKHIFGCDVIALGGGVMEACGDYLLPIVKKVVKKSHYMADHPMDIVLSALGDDAAITGAAAMAMQAIGLKLRDIQTQPAANRKKIKITSDGTFDVSGEEFFAGDMTVNVNGEVKPRRKNAKDCLDCPGKLKLRDLRRACESGPGLIYIGSDTTEPKELKSKAQTYLASRGIKYEVLDIDTAISHYNSDTGRKAIMILTGI